MIQVRDVPESVHDTVESQAAQEGMSLSDFIKRELERVTVNVPDTHAWSAAHDPRQ